MTLTVSAHAQNYGMGLYGGMQSCPYNYGAAEGSSDIQDEIARLQDDMKEAKYQMKVKKSELKAAERLKSRNQAIVEEVISSEFSSQVFSHIDGSVKACEYIGVFQPNAQGSQGSVPIPNCGAQPTDKVVSGFTTDQWKTVIDYNTPGLVKGNACGAPYRLAEKGRRTEQDCAKALVEYRKQSDKQKTLQSEMDELERSIESMKEEIATNRKDAREEARELARERRENPEGDYCPNCPGNRKKETNWGSVIGNVGLGIAAMGLGYYSGQHAVDRAADIGFPMDPYQSVGMGVGLGLPYVASGLSQAFGGQGLYGTIGGGIGAGAFGCAGNNGGPYGMMGPYGGANGNGMWGNPYAMGGYNPMGGGMYAPGMGPWGMNGPMGGMMGGFPGGMMISGGGGMMMPGMMAGGMMMPGMMAGGMAGGMMPGMMISGGGGMMMPGMMAGGMMPGMMAGGMAGGMMPGMMVGGMAGGMMPGMMMGGMAGGMMPGMMMGGMAGGMAGGMMPGMMMGSMMGGLGAMQMQQQMMQMQMQQYQQYVQQQYQKQQVTASLQTELYGLMYRIQQVQYGFGGDYLSGGIGGNIGIGSGVIPAPGYGGGGYNNGGFPGSGTGVIPAPGYNNGTGNSGTGGVILAPR
jgi:hypothetical protein